MDAFNILLNSSAAVHGHLCPGQVVGVRMAMLGCRLIDLDEPTSHDQIKKLIVYNERDYIYQIRRNCRAKKSKAKGCSRN